MSNRPIDVLLEDILERIDRIHRFVAEADLAEFRSNELLTDAVVRNLEIIGEAAWRLPKEFTLEHDGIPWPLIIGLRHRIVHEYFDVDVDLVWEIVSHELRAVQLQIRTLLQSRQG